MLWVNIERQTKPTNQIVFDFFVIIIFLMLENNLGFVEIQLWLMEVPPQIVYTKHLLAHTYNISFRIILQTFNF